MAIEYRQEPDLSVDEFIDLLIRSTLAERRPVADRARMDAMLRNASFTITGRDGKRLVGVARSISDFVYCTYLSELAVDEAYQGKGIGRELLERSRITGGPGCMLILLAAPKAESYYPHIGMEKKTPAGSLRANARASYFCSLNWRNFDSIMKTAF